MTEKDQKSHGRLAIQATAQPRELMTDRPILKSAWQARVITLFPEVFPGVLGASLVGKALQDGLWRLDTIDLRVFGEGKHRNVDDTPAGGGAGMVLRPDILSRAIRHAQRGAPKDPAKWPLVYVSPRGKPFDQSMAREFAETDGMTFICGRFEGVDERVLEHHNAREVSLGDFVMTGGEIAAMAMIDATVRLRPQIVGNAQSLEEESFASGLLEHPQYTRPQIWEGRAIPEVLQSGHHGNVAKWRQSEAERITRERRPDLWKAYQKSK